MSVIMLVTVWYVCPLTQYSSCNGMRLPVSSSTADTDVQQAQQGFAFTYITHAGMGVEL